MVASVVEHGAEADETLVSGAGEVDVFAAAERFGIEEVHLFAAPSVGLRGLVAIHSTALGPALGGTRCVRYPSFESALYDAFRLARGMSYKAAVHGLPFGGGKAVLLAPPVLDRRTAYFEAWGERVETLGGRFITAEDSGTSTADMDAVAKHTAHVAGTSALGDPAPYTARGVRRAIEAALAFACGRNALAGAEVAIQGVGNVGYHLAAQLIERGVRVTVADVDARRAERCAGELGARVVAPEAVYDVPADVFAPCALGGTINPRTIGRLKVCAVAGSANNQLENEVCAERLRTRGILYAPDYVANGGGLMMAAGLAGPQLQQRIDSIYDLLLEIFGIARSGATSPLTVANARAEAVLDAAAS